MSLAPSLTPDATENAEENAESRTPDAKENAASRILAAEDHYAVLRVGPPWTDAPIQAARRTSILSLACPEQC